MITGSTKGDVIADRYQFPLESKFEEIDGVRLHYVDEGTGPPILMVHDQPNGPTCTAR